MSAAHDISINLLLELLVTDKLLLVRVGFTNLPHLEEALIIFTATATVNGVLTILIVLIVVVRA